MLLLKDHLLECAGALATHVQVVVAGFYRAFERGERRNGGGQVLVFAGGLRSEEFKLNILLHIVIAKIGATQTACVPNHVRVGFSTAHF